MLVSLPRVSNDRVINTYMTNIAIQKGGVSLFIVRGTWFHRLKSKRQYRKDLANVGARTNAIV